MRSQENEVANIFAPMGAPQGCLRDWLSFHNLKLSLTETTTPCIIQTLRH